MTLQYFTAVDWLVIVVLFFSVVMGAWRGLVKEAISLVSWVLAFWVSQHFAVQLSAWLPMNGSSVLLREVTAFVLIFVVCLMVLSLVAWALQTMLSAVGLGGLNRLLGLLFGLVRGWLILMILTLVAQLTPLHESLAWQQAQSVPWLNGSLRLLKPALPVEFGKYITSCVESSAWLVTHPLIS